MVPHTSDKVIKVRAVFIKRNGNPDKREDLLIRTVRAHAVDLAKAWKLIGEKIAIIEEEKNVKLKERRTLLS